MADIVTGTVSGQLDISQLLMSQADLRREQESIGADIRREAASEAGDIRRETAKEASDSRLSGVDNTDRIVAQDTAYFIAGQSQNFSNATSLAALKAGQDAQFAQTLAAIQLAATQTAAAATLAGSKAESASALGQALIGQQIGQDGNTTRALINQQKIDDLNRSLIERNAQLVETFSDRRFSDLSNQINALHSQFQAAANKTVNFGTMGANTTASTNNVA